MRAGWAAIALAATWCVPLGAQGLDGLWVSDGYGYFVEIHGDSLDVSETTSISCISASHGTRKPGNAGDPAAVFSLDGDLIRLLPGRSPDEKRGHFDGAVSDVILHRVAAKPKACEQKPENTPQSNYAIFWQTFAEHYAFLDLRHIDWQAVDRKYRPRVTAATKPEELFGILQEMIEPLQDAHTGIGARDIKHNFHGMRPDANHLAGDDWGKARDLIIGNYVRGGVQRYCNGHVQFGILRDSIGYLRIDSFNSYAAGGYLSEEQALIAALDSVFRDARKLHGLVMDVRRNSGGADPLGVEIASRLTGERYLAYTKVTRNNTDGPLHFTAGQETWVSPSARPGFRGNAVLLTGPDTVSAGETFAMALMGREPHVTRIGLNTQGVFSDVLGRRLPNGWNFGLPNEVYLTKDGKAFDGPGVPPDVRLPFFAADDLAGGRDAALEKALEMLTGGGKP